jgi:hypothetical protein
MYEFNILMRIPLQVIQHKNFESLGMIPSNENKVFRLFIHINLDHMFGLLQMFYKKIHRKNIERVKRGKTKVMFSWEM